MLLSFSSAVRPILSNLEQKFKYAGITVIIANTILFWKIPDLYIHTQPPIKLVFQLALQVIELVLFH